MRIYFTLLIVGGIVTATATAQAGEIGATINDSIK